MGQYWQDSHLYSEMQRRQLPPHCSKSDLEICAQEEKIGGELEDGKGSDGEKVYTELEWLQTPWFPSDKLRRLSLTSMSLLVHKFFPQMYSAG